MVHVKLLPYGCTLDLLTRFRERFLLPNSRFLSLTLPPRPKVRSSRPRNDFCAACDGIALLDRGTECEAVAGLCATDERAEEVALCAEREPEILQGGEEGSGVDEVLIIKTDNTMTVDMRMVGLVPGGCVMMSCNAIEQCANRDVRSRKYLPG